MSCFTNWNQYSIKKQLLGTYVPLVSTALLVLLALLLSYIFVLTNDIINKSEKDLFREIIGNTQHLGTDNAELFTGTMEGNSKGFVFPYLHSTEISLEPEFNLENIPGYFEYGNSFLARPLSFDTRNNKQVSLKHSSFMVPGFTPANVASLNPNTINLINKTMHSDEFIVPSYQRYTDFVAGYSGFEQQGLYMKYPGIGTLTTDPNRRYDPRERGWYTTAFEMNNVIYTDPYRDFNTLQWMITIAKPIVHNGNIIGVAGADMLIDTIKDNIWQIRILGSGKATLLTSSGTVVADVEWTAESTSTTVFTYRNLINPPVNDDLWTEITGNVDLIKEQVDFYLVTKRITLARQNFYLLMTVPKDKMFEPINNITSDIKSARNSSIVTIVIVDLVVALLVVGVVWYIGNDLANSINELCVSSRQIMNNLGGDLGEGVEQLKGGSTYKELAHIQGLHNTIVQQLQTIPNEATNPLYGQGTEFGHAGQGYVPAPIPLNLAPVINVQPTEPEHRYPGQYTEPVNYGNVVHAAPHMDVKNSPFSDKV